MRLQFYFLLLKSGEENFIYFLLVFGAKIIFSGDGELF
jgi:hypothetical protein